MESEAQSNNRNASLSQIAEYGGSGSESDAERGAAEDAAELSEMVLKHNMINACAHGPLAPDAAPAPAASRLIGGPYRDACSDSDSDSDADSVKEIEEVSSGEEAGGAGGGAEVRAPRVAGELALEDLPPIEDLAISLPPHETTPMGTVYSIVDQLVIVKGSAGSAAVDLDTVLFLERGAKPLGRVFDVFGPVTEPHYAVRFNSSSHVAARGVPLGAEVSVAPRSHHTSYVFLPDLIKVKGSDASWKDDVEPPPAQLEYSDDEEERRARRAAREARAAGQGAGAERRPAHASSRFGSGQARGRRPAGRAAPGFPRPPAGFPRPPAGFPRPPPGFARPPPPFLAGAWGPLFAPYCPPPARYLHPEPPPPAT